MTERATVAAIFVHLVAVIFVLIPPLMWGWGRRRRPAAWLAYGVALALLTAWGVTSDRAGAATDEVRTMDSVLETGMWLALAWVAAAVSVFLGRRRRIPAP